MQIKTNYSNNPIWRPISLEVELPVELEALRKLIYNLWWVWNDEALDLFKELDPKLWVAVEENPVMLLNSLSAPRINEIVNDKALMSKIKAVCDDFEKYLSKPFDKSKTSVAYFSMEFGLTRILKIYSGGLGVLAGDYLKEASDSCVDLTGVGLLYHNGYFAQEISPDGQQIANTDYQNFEQIPVEQVLEEDGSNMLLSIPYQDRFVYSNVWKVNIGRICLYLLDTDVVQNSEFDRPITSQLYGGDWENRIKQEILLGIGGILMLNKLGIKKDIYHCNEGHAALLNIQRIQDLIEQNGLSFNEALEVVRSSSLYTVHTPVPAGHDYFDEGLFGKYFSNYPEKLGISWNELMDMGRENPGSNEKFSMSVFALNTCQEANGVSYLHGIVSRKMFQPLWPAYFPEELHVGYVTNGVHMPTWTSKEMKAIYESNFSKDWYDDESNEKIWEEIHKVPDETLWNAKKALKQKLVKYIYEHVAKGLSKYQTDPSGALANSSQIDPNALLVGFGRRFATYKRAHLLFMDLDRLSKLVNNKERPIQFLYTGKAHPADGGGQGLIKHIVEISKRPEFAGKILFLQNYDMNLAKHLIPGVDVWLNTPTRPLEASGTSGEKAVMNGVVNFSVLDGWWYEGYRENAGWCLTDKRTYENQAYQDELDAATIYSIFENEIVPTYYDRNKAGFSPKWMQYVKNTISGVAPHYTMKRMIDDYIERFYKKLQARHNQVLAKDYALAKSLAAWKIDTASKWDSIEVVDSNCLNSTNSLHLTSLVKETMSIVIDKKDIQGDLGLDCVITTSNIGINNSSGFVESLPFTLVKTEGSKQYFELKLGINKSGIFNYGFRLYPNNKDLAYRTDFSYVRWL